jgi:CubicO group peptidase (beta-lactamase class C family)
MNSKKNSDRTLQGDIKKLLDKGVCDGVFSCAATGILRGVGKERKKIITYCGNASQYPKTRKLKKNNFFDLASLTKPLATTMAILCLLKMNKIDVDEKLPSLLEKKIKGDKKNTSIKQLLGHCSGLPAHREYFKILKDVPVDKKRGFVENLLLSEKFEYEPETKAVYSDLGFMLLGRIIEKKAGYSLEKFVGEKVMKPINLEKNVFFNPLFGNHNIHSNKEFVPTENCPWRKKTLYGEVHDDNCYAMGGVAGHSGLFGDIESVTNYAGLILDMWKDLASHPNIRNRDLINFLVRQHKIPGSTRTLGFDTITRSGSSSGKHFSKKSVGHLGFSGTSFWIDPEKDVVVVLLSNRVHPSRENTKIKQFRPYFHDMVFEKIFRT